MDSALWGTALGGAIAIVGSLTTIRASRKSAIMQTRRDELRGACADLLTSCDDLWAADERVKLAVFTMVNYERRTDAGREERAAANQDRTAAFAKHADANDRARRARDIISLVAPELDGSASALFDASGYDAEYMNPLPSAEQREEHQAARQRFITEARRHL